MFITQHATVKDISVPGHFGPIFKSFRPQCLGRFGTTCVSSAPVSLTGYEGQDTYALS